MESNRFSRNSLRVLLTCEKPHTAIGPVVIIAIIIGLCASATDVSAQRFELSFSPRTPTIFVAPLSSGGLSAPEVYTSQIDVVVTSSSPAHRGVQGWSFGVSVEGGAMATMVETNPSISTLWDAGEIVDGNAVHAAVIAPSFGEFPVGDVILATVTIAGTVGTPATLFFADGLTGSGQPVDNTIVYQGMRASHVIIQEQLNILPDGQLVSSPVGPDDGVVSFIRGDGNDDGVVDIADAVWIVNELFRGGPSTVCNNRNDANDDESVNLVLQRDFNMI